MSIYYHHIFCAKNFSEEEKEGEGEGGGDTFVTKIKIYPVNSILRIVKIFYSLFISKYYEI